MSKKTAINLLVFLLLSSLLTACSKTTPKHHPIPQEKDENHPSVTSEKVKTFSVRGLDISKYQGSVDFSQLKANGFHYVFIRATEGITYQDEDYKSNYAAAKKAGLKVGVYHFYESDDDPIAQLENIKDLVELTVGDLAPVIDIEKLHQKDDKSLAENLKKLLDGLESHYGIKPIIYTGKNFANQYLFGFNDYPLWLAEYEVEQPTLPSGWQDWTFWQWSQSGTVNGIVGVVDMDRFNGSHALFEKLLIQ